MAASEPTPGQRASSTDDAIPPDRGSLNPAPSGASATGVTNVSKPLAHRKSGASRLLGRTFESLSIRDYRLLWFSMMTGMSGTQMQMLAREGFLPTAVLPTLRGPPPTVCQEWR